MPKWDEEEGEAVALGGPGGDTGRAMSQENVERAERAVAAINETYRTGDTSAWSRRRTRPSRKVSGAATRE